MQYPSANDPLQPRKKFAEYKSEAHNWITLATGDYYPDILTKAKKLYEPVLLRFKELLEGSSSSEELLSQISNTYETWMRIQLLRVFRKYVSPSIPVEMTKKKSDIKNIIEKYGSQFREIQEVRTAYRFPDETLCAILWEYKDRGKKGYDLTEKFFNIFNSKFKELTIRGLKRGSKDISIKEVFRNYPEPDCSVDFTIHDNKNNVLAIGLARYDSDRGGAQEDDRIGHYTNIINKIVKHTRDNNLNTKIIILNDGPGLLLGSMWNDYANLEKIAPEKVMVLTLKMVPTRLTLEWLTSNQRT